MDDHRESARNVSPLVSSIQEWLALQEFVLPTGTACETFVIRAAFLVAPTELIQAFGIRGSPILGPNSGRSLLGMVVLQNANSRAVLRLPPTVAGWAAECCASVGRGWNPFPARVIFRDVGAAIEITFPDGGGPVSVSQSPSELDIYIDESGNTGDAIIPATGPAFGDQPSFAWVGVGAGRGAHSLSTLIDRLRGRHGIGANELKGRAIARRPAFVPNLIRALCEEGTPIFIELMDKWHYVGTNIVTYVLGSAPWFELTTAPGRTAANALADLLVEELSSRVLSAYSAFAIAPSPEALNAFEIVLRDEFKASRHSELGLQTRSIVELGENALADAFAIYRERSKWDADPFLSFLPPPDRSLGSASIAMLPHIPAFTHLYARVNRYSSRATSVRVVHDAQDQFGHLLEAYASSLGTNEYANELAKTFPSEHAKWDFVAEKISFNFADSKATPGIQIADIIAGFCTRRMNRVIQGLSVRADEGVRDLLALKDTTNSVGLNLVSTEKRLQLFCR